MNDLTWKERLNQACYGSRVGHFSQAACVAPDTLRKKFPLARVWLITFEEIRKRAGRCPIRIATEEGKLDQYVTTMAELVLERLEAVAKRYGIATVVVDEPDMLFDMNLLATKLNEVGLITEIHATSRHRYCPHTNSRNKKCNYDGEFDGGAGEINDVQLQVFIPRS